MRNIVLGVLVTLAAGTAVVVMACQGPTGLEGLSGSPGPSGSGGPPGPPGTVTLEDGGSLVGLNFGANLISWRYEASLWQVLGGTPVITVVVATDGGAPEGDSSFQVANSTAVNAGVAAFGGYIAVDPSRWYGSRISAKLVTGGGTFSAGFVAYDGNRQVIKAPTGKAGSVAFLADGKTLSSASWTTYSGIINGEGLLAGNFPAGTRYIRPLVVTNDFGTNTGTGTTLVSSFEFYRLPGQASTLYQTGSWCASAGTLTFVATCKTVGPCNVNFPGYYDCAGGCPFNGPQLTCNNTLVGTLVTLP